jgi:imidazolonepropionase-like amidohydrolase
MAGSRWILVLLASFSLGVVSTTWGAEALAIQSGTILTVSRGMVEHGTLLIEGGKITGLGQEVLVPEGARVIEAKGKYVIPGLIDASSQLFVREGEVQDDDAVSPELSILDALDPFIKEREEVLAQGVTAVYVAPGHGVLGGSSAVLRLNPAQTTPAMVLKPNVAIKGTIGLSHDGHSSSLDRLADFAALREAFVETQTYLREKRRYEQDLAEYEKKKAETKKEQKKDENPQKAKKDLPARPAKYKINPGRETLAQVLAGELPVQIEAHRAEDILNALRLADEFHLRLILDRCTEGYRVADEIARRGVPVIAGPPSRSFVSPPTLEYRDQDARNAAFLSAQGVKVALGVGGRDGASSKFVGLVAALAVAGGMEKGLALRAVTLTPAEILGVADRIGSLDVGKDADIVILSGPPLQTSSQVEMVLIEGKIVYGRKASQ